ATVGQRTARERAGGTMRARVRDAVQDETAADSGPDGEVKKDAMISACAELRFAKRCGAGVRFDYGRRQFAEAFLYGQTAPGNRLGACDVAAQIYHFGNTDANGHDVPVCGSDFGPQRRRERERILEHVLAAALRERGDDSPGDDLPVRRH